MEHEIENLIEKYFKEDNIEEINTSKLINKLKPDIVHKCTEIKARKRNVVDTAVFILSCLMALLAVGYLLFPDIIDYSDEIIQFIVFSLVVGVLLIGINLIVQGLSVENSDSSVIKLRGRLS